MRPDACGCSRMSCFSCVEVVKGCVSKTILCVSDHGCCGRVMVSGSSSGFGRVERQQRGEVESWIAIWMNRMVIASSAVSDAVQGLGILRHPVEENGTGNTIAIGG